MKLLLQRATVLLIISLLLLLGLVFFTGKYFSSASTWAHHPLNRHLYSGGKLTAPGTVYDRSGSVLVQLANGSVQFHENQAVRTAVMHATGDLDNNVATGALVTFRDRLSGWNIINGLYRLDRTGRELTLTLDVDLCTTAYRELGGRKGTVGVYNYKTGEILCLVSTPSVDPANPPDVSSEPEKYEGVFINRFLSAAYTPGSVFKLVTAAAAIDTVKEIEQKRYRCDGKIHIGEDTVTCPSAHGEVTLEEALARSCNVAFAEIALELGPNTLQEYANSAGFNSRLEVDGINTAKGRVDLSGARGADLAWAGIGQYTNTANPLNFMAYMGAIANDGVRVNPTLLKEERWFPSFIPAQTNRMLPSQTARELGEMMRFSTLHSYGESNFPGLELCAKSGTAEVGGGKKPHAWFAGFLDREDAPLAFVVVIENGGSGLEVAGPVAAKVLQAALR